MIKKTPIFTYDRCVNCGMCVQACPVSALAMTLFGRQGKYKNVFPEKVSDSCGGCGMCAKACVMGCISMEAESGDEG